MAGKVGVPNIQPPHRHRDAHVRREPGMGRQPVRFRLPASRLKALWPVLVVPEPCLVLAIDDLLAGKSGLFLAALAGLAVAVPAHRITRTGASGSGPKKRSRMDSSPPR